jgi:hypothetical protein
MYDQTDWSWLANLTVNQLGTGIYLVPPGSPPGKPQLTAPPLFPSRFGPPYKRLEPGVTYDACKQNACTVQAMVFKWVPHTIASFSDIQQTQCSAGPCTDTCVTPGCICNPDKLVCE